MELKLSKSMDCRMAARGRWGNYAAAAMGASFFLRIVHYFAMVNLYDVPGFEIFFCVVLPLIVSVGFILMLKLPKLNHPLAGGILAVVYAVDYFFCEQMNFGGVVSGLLLLAAAGLILAAVLGYIPERKWLLWAAAAALAVRIVFVDVFGYILPLTELKLFAYIPMASNLFGLAAICFLAPSLRLRKQ